MPHSDKKRRPRGPLKGSSDIPTFQVETKDQLFQVDPGDFRKPKSKSNVKVDPEFQKRATQAVKREMMRHQLRDIQNIRAARARQVRLMQRKPETYKSLLQENPRLRQFQNRLRGGYYER